MTTAPGPQQPDDAWPHRGVPPPGSTPAEAAPGSDVTPWAPPPPPGQGGPTGYGPGPHGPVGHHHPGHGGPAGPPPPPLAYKDTTAAYLLWFFLAGFGAHKFYLRQPGVAVTYIVLFFLGWATTWLLVGFLLLAVFYVLVVVDAFRLPAQVRAVNADIYARAAHGWR